jgi:hypothetical protein
MFLFCYLVLARNIPLIYLYFISFVWRLLARFFKTQSLRFRCIRFCLSDKREHILDMPVLNMHAKQYTLAMQPQKVDHGSWRFLTKHVLHTIQIAYEYNTQLKTLFFLIKSDERNKCNKSLMYNSRC